MEKIKKVFNQLELASNELSKAVSERILFEDANREEETKTDILCDAVNCMKTEVLGKIGYYICTNGTSEQAKFIKALLADVEQETFDSMIARETIESKSIDNRKFSRNLRIEKYTEIIKLCSTLIGHISSDSLTCALSEFIDTLQEEIRMEVKVAGNDAHERYYKHFDILPD